MERRLSVRSASFFFDKPATTDGLGGVEDRIELDHQGFAGRVSARG